jgi:phage-related protein (TIGR01555 family)
MTSAAVKTDSFNTDGFVNLLTALGVEGQDKRLNATAAEPVTLSQQELNQLYRGDDIVARICNLPANEMVKKWFQVKATEDGDREKIDAIMQVLKDLGAKAAIREALVWARLHGGSVILVGADDGREQHEPLDLENVRSVDYLTVLDRWDLEVVAVYGEAGKPNYRLPEIYRIRQVIQPVSGHTIEGKPQNVTPLTVDPVVHESRLVRFDGVLTPAVEKLKNLGWCDSAVIRVYEVVRDYQTSYSGVGLMMTALKHDKEGLILTRLQLMNVSRSVARAVPLDLDGEDLVYPQQRIQGISELLGKFDVRLSMALGWPATVLLGQAPKGLNATGESDLTNWYDYIQGEQERNLDPQLTKLCRIVFATLEAPKTWSVSFPPLWQVSAEEVAKERKTYAETDALNIDRGVYTAEEASESRYGGDEYGTEINLDKELRDTDKIPSADPADVPGLRDEGKTEKPQDEAMAAGQISALTDVVKAFNKEELTREQAIAILVVTFQMEKEDAAALVGLEPLKKEPAPIPPGLQPQPPGVPPVFEPEPEPEPEPNTDSIEKRGSKWVVLSEAGKVLGMHETEEGAKKQLRKPLRSPGTHHRRRGAVLLSPGAAV